MKKVILTALCTIFVVVTLIYGMILLIGVTYANQDPTFIQYMIFFAFAIPATILSSVINDNKGNQIDNITENKKG